MRVRRGRCRGNCLSQRGQSGPLDDRDWHWGWIARARWGRSQPGRRQVRISVRENAVASIGGRTEAALELVGGGSLFGLKDVQPLDTSGVTFVCWGRQGE
jgi:hypothetical protein